MMWHVFSALRGIVVGIFMTEYRKRRYSRRSSSARKSHTPTDSTSTGRSGLTFSTRRDSLDGDR